MCHNKRQNLENWYDKGENREKCHNKGHAYLYINISELVYVGHCLYLSVGA